MKKKIFYTIILMFASINLLQAITYNAVVAKDGTGNYTTVQAAFNAVPSNSSSRWIIYIKNGTYTEFLTLPSTKKNVTIIGQSRDGVILTYNKYATDVDASGVALRTNGATLSIQASGFYAQNVTIKNTAGTAAQALALYVSGDKAIFNGCSIVANQDTYYGGYCRCFFRVCYIEGTTDFIYGPVIAYFESCRIVTKGGSAITAASTPDYIPYGMVFQACDVTGSSTTLLGRTWRAYASTSFLNGTISSVINTPGWSDWGNLANDATARYNEYNNTGAGAYKTGRVSWCHLLTSSQAANYSRANVLKGTHANPQVIDNWDPYVTINATKSAEYDGTENIEAFNISAPSISIYPNPVTSGPITIALNNFGTGACVKVIIYDLLGKAVLKETFQNKSEITIDKKLNSGVYIVAIDGSNTSIKQKFVVK